MTDKWVFRVRDYAKERQAEECEFRPAPAQQHPLAFRFDRLGNDTPASSATTPATPKDGGLFQAVTPVNDPLSGFKSTTVVDGTDPLSVRLQPPFSLTHEPSGGVYCTVPCCTG